jgi:DNA-binding protein H-NS
VASLDVLKEKLQKEIEKRDKAETNIKRLEIRIEQEELSTIKATMKAHNVSFSELQSWLNSQKTDDTGATYENS